VSLRPSSRVRRSITTLHADMHLGRQLKMVRSCTSQQRGPTFARHCILADTPRKHLRTRHCETQKALIGRVRMEVFQAAAL
jgi:hypothetical protein